MTVCGWANIARVDIDENLAGTERACDETLPVRWDVATSPVLWTSYSGVV
jgi:hypothetical protein